MSIVQGHLVTLAKVSSSDQSGKVHTKVIANAWAISDGMLVWDVLAYSGFEFDHDGKMDVVYDSQLKLVSILCSNIVTFIQPSSASNPSTVSWNWSPLEDPLLDGLTLSSLLPPTSFASSASSDSLEASTRKRLAIGCFTSSKVCTGATVVVKLTVNNAIPMNEIDRRYQVSVDYFASFPSSPSVASLSATVSTLDSFDYQSDDLVVAPVVGARQTAVQLQVVFLHQNSSAILTYSEEENDAEYRLTLPVL